MNINPKKPDWDKRDRLIFSKGHSCSGLYSILAMKDYFKMSELESFTKIGSILQGHPDMTKVPGVDITSGSLGQGLSVGVGMAIGILRDNLKCRVYVILGDGELDEGQIWEACMSAYKYKLDNLIAIVDYNNLQLDGLCSDIMPLEPLDKKWESFGWDVFKIDGHDYEQILDIFKRIKEKNNKPKCIIARTIKGKGISFMENSCEWHGKIPDENQFKLAIKELTN